MDKQMEGKEIAALINAGWTPPKVDYDAWRPALAAFNAAKGYTSEAERISDVDNRPLLRSDCQEIDALALAFKAAPKSDD